MLVHQRVTGLNNGYITQFLHVHIMNQLDPSKARGPARGPHADPADCGTVPGIPQPAAEVESLLRFSLQLG